MKKKRPEVFDGIPTTFTGKLFATAIRCHCFAVIASTLMASLIGWIWVNQEWFAADPYQTTEKIEHARMLISESDQWTKRFNESRQLAMKNAKRTGEIRAWLPKSIDWEVSSATIEELASRNELQLILLERDDDASGSRVSVAQANCMLSGSFEHICQFLDALPKMSHPIWCDSLQLALDQNQAALPNADSQIQADEVYSRRCTATLTLRLPFAGKNTAAEKLFALEVNHAS